jgi:ATP-dependent exoDNAse (exonuclease V) alpha subunit
MERAETLAMARKKVKGKSSRERTGKMVIGKFRHAVSRDKDPQLHTHAIALNMTLRSDGAWRALVADDLYRVQHELDAVYKLELANRVQALGYEIRMSDAKGNFELAHISRDQIEAFSARSATIENALAKQGKTRLTATSLEKQRIALATRRRKEKTSIENVRTNWLERSEAVGISYIPDSWARLKRNGSDADPGQADLPADAKTDSITLEIPESEIVQPVKTGAGNHTGKPDRKTGVSEITPSTREAIEQTSPVAEDNTAQGVVRHAIKHLTEREACVTEGKLITTALQRAVGLQGVNEASVRREIVRLEKTGSLIPNEQLYVMAGSREAPRIIAAWVEKLRETKHWEADRAKRYVERAIASGTLIARERSFTTPVALKQEKAILAIEREGRGTVAPLMTSQTLDVALSGATLNDGQRAAVKTIVGTNNRFVGIQGDAGTGKTYAVREAVSLVNQATGSEYKVLALAPYGTQVKVLKQDGMEAKTLASFLYSKDKKIDDKTLVVLDEAAVVGSRQMAELMRAVEKAGSRLVMLGDTKQTEAIEAGKPFAQLQQAGMEISRISEILRQKDLVLKRAVEKVAAGDAKASVKDMAVVEIESATKRHQTMVDDLMRLSPAERDNTLIIAGTNDARRQINDMVRQAFQLTGKGRELDTLDRADMTQAQRRVTDCYAEGMIIQPERDYPKYGLVRWESYEIVRKLQGNELEVKAEKDGTLLVINPRKITKLSVYDLSRTEIAIGDVVRVTRNDISKDLTNGDRLRVVGVAPGLLTVIRIDDKTKTPLDLDTRIPLHLEHAYSSTVHSSQGMTSDNILISLDVHSRTTSKNLYYVAISRAKYAARIYTNSATKLPDKVSRLLTKTTALSLDNARKQAKYRAKETREFSHAKF